MPEVFTNQPIGTVTSGGTTAPAAGTIETWTVSVTTAFAATSGNFFRAVDAAAPSEVILVTSCLGGTGSQTWSVTRGAEGTPVAHSAGFTVIQDVTAGTLASFTQTLVPTPVKTAAYTASPGDLVLVDCTSASVPITAPASPTGNASFAVKMVKQDTPKANKVTIAANTSQTFNDDASTSLSLPLVNQSAVLQWDTALSAWVKVAGDAPLAGLDGRYEAAGTAAVKVSAETVRAMAAETERGRWANAGSGGPRIITILGGQTDETITTSGTGTPTVAADTTNYQLGSQGWQLSMAASGTASFIYTQGTAWTPPPVAAIGLACYIPSLTNLTSVTVQVTTTGGGTWANTLYASSTPVIAAGWNYIRWPAPSSNPAGLQYPITSVRVVVAATGATSVTAAQVWLECPPKAQLMVIADGAYYSDFVLGTYSGTSPGGIPFVGGYPDLKALGIPVVWAPDTALVGQNTGTYAPPSDRATWAQLAAVMNDGNGNEMNYHGSSGNATQSMTSAQIVTEIMAAIKALEQQGYPNPPVKGAWSQNEATNAAAAKPYMLGYRSPSGASGTPVACWPPANMWNIPSQELDQSITWSTIQTTLQNTHGLCCTYLHGIDPVGPSGAIDATTPAQWGQFLDFIQAGLSGGWLEGVTFQQLMARDGYKYRRTNGQWVQEYVDTTGSVQRVKLP